LASSASNFFAQKSWLKKTIRRDIGEISATFSSGKRGETLMKVLDHSHDFSGGKFKTKSLENREQKIKSRIEYPKDTLYGERKNGGDGDDTANARRRKPPRKTR
jgi:hypothetical protein